MGFEFFIVDDVVQQVCWVDAPELSHRVSSAAGLDYRLRKIIVIVSESEGEVIHDL